MSRNIIPSIVLAVLASFGTLAQAQDLPAMVGRISAAQGQVTLTGPDEPVAASLNYPVTRDNHVNTASGARAEFRVGSTAVRLDGDSDLEITDMDDDVLRLRLNYGSVSIRLRSPELLRDFELSTPQARITMIEPGVLRVDVDRVADTSQISVLGGVARVDGAGSSLTVNSGRHVDVTSEDVRTSVARRDGFDSWSDDRDRAYADSVAAVRYVSTGITGYEELDRNGSWSDSAEYGTLWTPRNVAADWAPYRDGRWIWLAPWGWTWVDNAPWGYAPSHYGRWVMVGRRWCWAPGRPAGRPVWAPALVGWVGGNGIGPGRGPGLGWFPLSPRERYVPNYRASPDQVRRLDWTHNGKPLTPGPGRPDRRDGLTVMPRENFDHGRTVQVGRGAQVIPSPSQIKNVAQVAPPQPAGRPRVVDTRRSEDRDNDGIPDRNERNDRAGRNDRNERNPGQPGRVLTAPSQPVNVPQNQPRQQTTTLAPNQFGSRDAPAQTIRPEDVRIELRPRGGQPGQATSSTSGTSLNAAPVIQVAPNRERTDRGDDGQRRFRGGQDEQRQAPAQQVQQQQQEAQQQAQQQLRQQAQQQQAQQQAAQQQQRQQALQQQEQAQQQRQQAQQQQVRQQEAQQQQRQPAPQAQPARENRDAGRNEQRKEPEKHKDDRDNRKQNQQ